MKSFIYTFAWAHVDLLNARGRKLATLDKPNDEQCGTAESYGRQKYKARAGGGEGTTPVTPARLESEI